jgi:c-di-GMP-binding flagellar brake protein YcgR
MTVPDRTAVPASGSASPLSDNEIAVLEALALEGTMIDARLASGVQAFHTRLLLVDPGRRFILIQAGEDTAANARLLAGPRANLYAELGEWRIEFNAETPLPVSHEGTRAVRLAFPASIAISRRRQQERVIVPTHYQLRCVGQAVGGARFEATVTDVSPGGIGLLQEASGRLEPGTVLSGCRLERPGKTPVEVDLEVRYTERVALPDGRPGRKVGYRFVNPSPAMRELIGEFFSRAR